VTLQKFAGVESILLKAGTVARDEEPMADCAAKEFNRTEGGEFVAQFWIHWVRSLRKNKPNAVVARGFGRIPEHANKVIAEIDREAREHAADLGVQGHERLQNEGVRRLLFWFAGSCHDFCCRSDVAQEDCACLGNGHHFLNFALRARVDGY
jgi:hypothetical protein